MKSMKQRRARTVEELFSAPEGEWFYDPHGREVEVVDDTSGGIEGALCIPVAKSTAARLRLRPGERFTGHYVRGALVIRRIRHRRAQRPG